MALTGGQDMKLSTGVVAKSDDVPPGARPGNALTFADRMIAANVCGRDIIPPIISRRVAHRGMALDAKAGNVGDAIHAVGSAAITFATVKRDRETSNQNAPGHNDGFAAAGPSDANTATRTSDRRAPGHDDGFAAAGPSDANTATTTSDRRVPGHNDGFAAPGPSDANTATATGDRKLAQWLRFASAPGRDRVTVDLSGDVDGDATDRTECLSCGLSLDRSELARHGATACVALHPVPPPPPPPIDKVTCPICEVVLARDQAARHCATCQSGVGVDADPLAFSTHSSMPPAMDVMSPSDAAAEQAERLRRRRRPRAQTPPPRRTTPPHQTTRTPPRQTTQTTLAATQRAVLGDDVTCPICERLVSRSMAERHCALCVGPSADPRSPRIGLPPSPSDMAMPNVSAVANVAVIRTGQTDISAAGRVQARPEGQILPPSVPVSPSAAETKPAPRSSQTVAPPASQAKPTPPAPTAAHTIAPAMSRPSSVVCGHSELEAILRRGRSTGNGDGEMFCMRGGLHRVRNREPPALMHRQGHVGQRRLSCLRQDRNRRRRRGRRPPARVRLAGRA